MSCSRASSSASRAPAAFSDSHADDALRMPGHRHRRRALQIKALALHGAHGGHLSEQDARPGDRGGGELLRGGQRLFGGQRPDPLQRLEADRPHHDQFAGDRLEEERGLADDLAQLGLDAGRADQLLQVLQPRTALTTKRHRIRLAGVQTIDEGMSVEAPRGRVTVAAGRQPVVLVDRHFKSALLVAGSGASRSRIGRRLPRVPWSTDMSAVSIYVVMSLAEHPNHAHSC